jgi:hypothetical protein
MHIRCGWGPGRLAIAASLVLFLCVPAAILAGGDTAEKECIKACAQDKKGCEQGCRMDCRSQYPDRADKKLLKACEASCRSECQSTFDICKDECRGVVTSENP